MRPYDRYERYAPYPRRRSEWRTWHAFALTLAVLVLAWFLVLRPRVENLRAVVAATPTFPALVLPTPTPKVRP